LASLILIAVAFRDQFSSSVSTGRVSGGCVGTRLIVNTKRSGLGSQKQMPASCSSFSRFGVLGATRSTLRFRGGGDDGRATFINCVNEGKEEFSSYLSEAGANRASLERIIEEFAESHHDEVAFLLENMPKKHLREIPYEILASSITLSKRLREEAPWGGDVPLEIYLNDVLPYSCVTEPIEDWRPFLHAKFAQKAFDEAAGQASTAASIEKAALWLNENVFRELNVTYKAFYPGHHPDQGVFESMSLGYASCTGLSVILVAACRSVGIPARVAGTPSWTTDSSGLQLPSKHLKSSSEMHTIPS